MLAGANCEGGFLSVDWTLSAWILSAWILSGSLPPFPLYFLIKNNKEIAPQSSGSSLLPVSYGFLLKTIRKLLQRAPDPLSSLFLTFSY